ncbi:Queuine tRNA-ribosyltransferase [Coccomyxa subellipsoidea C-169]|uniref:Queuine tRNA-ribosyltransferase catalytic subunit 1 n=1 Tax=Coccomyxa subellipsoidea (strain C-169) TaxID=574566 RepID=I0YTE6_COCSC|nr:Queuine tRNA-ribosyltransferase [Coccomyxa subellipsoidea C-169]EIE21665.1 Queuine tRNA-ribosyltransferase [Coccomyxa subellipsoidea C-169]|eukprot:XP_005646209.1 Queuine tRNA-ribosyltransferase [Coccomyxa subellipsoidea C-169]
MQEDAAELPSSVSPALTFEVLAAQGRARASRMTLPHFAAETPMFMPVGTKGTVKGLTSQQLVDLNCHVILGNTYHLEERPGSELVSELGGLHKFMDWPRGMLTDSGGFQMVSLLHLAEITEEGVQFQSPVDGSLMMLTPERSIAIQNKLGADIIMALDDVVSSVNPSRERFTEATHRTTRWIDRCIKAHARPHEQNLFAIVQGGLDEHLRAISIKDLSERNLPGYAVGGLAGGESKDDFWRVVAQCTAPGTGLPPDKPRYVMGVGYPLDIVISLGADMFDSVYPTRTARFGVALVPSGVLKLKNVGFTEDFRPLDKDCPCMTCKKYTRALLHNLVAKGIPFAAMLVSLHNVAYTQRLTQQIRDAIRQQRFPEFVQEFVRGHFPAGTEVPQWVFDALAECGISLP